MKNSKIYSVLVDVIKQRIPDKKELINRLMDILYLEKEAVYRRLRGDVYFSFDELVYLCKELDISMDNVISMEVGTEKNIPARITNTDFIHANEADYQMWDNFCRLLNKITPEINAEWGTATNTVPQVLYLESELIYKFFLFKGAYHSGIPSRMCKYGDVEYSDRLKQTNRVFVDRMKQARKTFIVLDRHTFELLVNDINYFLNIRLITVEEVKALKEALHKLIDETERIVAKGSFGKGNKLEFYISGISIRSNQLYISLEDYLYISMIEWFTFIDTVSMDPLTLERMKNKLNSFKRTSTLISDSGEIQRVMFFRKQRELINSLLS